MSHRRIRPLPRVRIQRWRLPAGPGYQLFQRSQRWNSLPSAPKNRPSGRCFHPRVACRQEIRSGEANSKGMRRPARRLTQAILALLMLALMPMPSTVAGDLQQVAVIPPGSDVFFGEFWARTSPELSAKHLIQAWNDQDGGHVLLAEYPNYDWDGSIRFFRLEETHGSSVTLTVSPDLRLAKLQAVLPSFNVSITMDSDPIRQFWGGCITLGHSYFYFSPTQQITIDGFTGASGTINGQPIY